MPASWFRLKYPYLALGALASSAPILYFDDITPQDGYYSVASKDYRVCQFFFLLFFSQGQSYSNWVRTRNLTVLTPIYLQQKGFINFLLQEASETCYQTIQKSWAEIDEVASKPNGLDLLSKKFKTCK